MNIKYKVGDKVKLRESSQFYYQAPDEIGEIIEFINDQNGDPDDTIFCFMIKFPSITNGYRPIDIKLVESASLIGRYIKALIDYPHGGSVKKGEIGKIIREREVDFPSQKGYCISLPLMTSLYELLPVDYVPTPPYVAQPFPSDGEYIKLIVKHDINRKDVGTPGDMPDVIPKGIVTWCTKHYKSSILDNSTICIESNVYRANIYASCFEIHPDSKHLFEESKVVSDSIKEGDTVKVVHVSPTDEEWVGVGKIPISFKIGDIVTVSCIGTGYEINKGSYYSKSMFEKVDEKQLPIDSTPPVSESTKSIDKLDDDTEIPPIVVHCTTKKEFEHVVKHHNLSKYMSFTTYRGETGVSINGTHGYDGWTSIRSWKICNKNSKILTYSEWVSKYMPVLDDPVLEPIKPIPKFKVGDRVIAIAESDGWGDVKKGDVGTVVGLYDENNTYNVDFPNQKNWLGKERCFQLAETIIKDDTFSVTNTELVTTSIVEKFTNPIRDIESVNVLITKKSKIKLLKI
jgi:hypothetical protein